MARQTPNPGRGFRGTNGPDTIIGTDGADRIWGLAGWDTIEGRGGDDIIYGGYDPDTIYGGDGNDYLDGGGRDNNLDVLFGGAGDDTMVNATRAHADGGLDLIDDVYVVHLYGIGSAGIVATPNGVGGYDVTSGGVTTAIIHDAHGTAPWLVGTSAADEIHLASGGSVTAGDGDDSIYLGSPTANVVWVNGGTGIDTLHLTVASQFLGVSNTDSQVRVDGVQYATVDAMPNYGTGFERIVGSSGDDVIELGGSSIRTADGGGGNDILRMGWYETRLTGGSGADDFEVTTGGDAVITDFGTGSDEIHLYGGSTVTWAYSDTNGDGVLDAVGTVSNGASVTLLGYGGLTPEPVVVSHEGAPTDYWA